MEKDLFEMIKNAVGCEYISDLRFGMNNRKAQVFLRNADIENYSLSVLSDAAQYIFSTNIKFSSKGEATGFFRSENKNNYKQ